MKNEFKVDFMIIGAQHSATTSLSEQLSKHPEICFCKQKEPAYFNTVKNWEGELQQYHSLYSPAGAQICGEASTSYTFLPEYAETHIRLYGYNPRLKLIYIMRKPIERIRSHYAQRVAKGRIQQNLEDAIFEDPVYINRTRYGYQIRPYLELFGLSRILMLVFEEYVQDQAGTLMQIASFLEIDPARFGKTDQKPKNFSDPRHKPVLSREKRDKLNDLLREDVQMIEHWMGRRIDAWHQVD